MDEMEILLLPGEELVDDTEEEKCTDLVFDPAEVKSTELVFCDSDRGNFTDANASLDEGSSTKLVCGLDEDRSAGRDYVPGGNNLEQNQGKQKDKELVPY